MPAALIAGTVVGAIVKGKAEKQAAQAQVDASNAAIVEQRRQYDQTRQDQMPWMTAGTPSRVVAALNGAFNASLRAGDVVEVAGKEGQTLLGGTPADEDKARKAAAASGGGGGGKSGSATSRSRVRIGAPSWFIAVWNGRRSSATSLPPTSSSAFASCKSFVSNPSVSQL